MRLFAKSILKKPSFLIILLIMPLLTLFGSVYSKSNSVMLHYGFYVDGDVKSDVMKCFLQDLSEYSGLTDFTEYSDVETMKLDIRKGNLEGGYVLPADLDEQMDAGNRKEVISVYINRNTTTNKVINMSLFEVFFKYYSLHLAENGLLEKVSEEVNLEIYEDAVSYYRDEGSTFGFEFLEMTNSTPTDSTTLYKGLVTKLIVLTMFFFVISGYIAYAGKRMQGFRLRLPYAKAFPTYCRFLSVYLIASLTVGGICLWILNAEKPFYVLGHFLLLVLAFALILLLLYVCRVPSSLVTILLPVYTICNCLFNSELFDLSVYLKALSFVKYFLIVSLF